MAITQVQLASILVRADYVVEVHVQSYSNPTNRAVGQGGDCCDPQSGGNRSCTETKRCDSYFIFCLRPLNTPPIQRGCDTPNITSEVAKNNASIDFTQHTFFGITNPFHLNASGLWQVSVFTIATKADTHDTHLQGVQLYVEVKDRDYTTTFNDSVQDDLIDVFAIYTVGTYTAATIIGIHGYGRISVTTSVHCAESYIGDPCQFVNKCERDNIECSGLGVCVAKVDTYVCNCEPGYTGMYCEMTDYCFKQNCSGNGQCFNGENNFSCKCYHGFTGELCNTVFQAEGELILDTIILSTSCSMFLWTEIRVFPGEVVGGMGAALAVLIIVIVLLLVVIVLLLRRRKSKLAVCMFVYRKIHLHV